MKRLPEKLRRRRGEPGQRHPRTTSELLGALRSDGDAGPVTLGEIEERTSGRVLGLLLLLLVLPELVPALGLSLILALPIFVIGAYMVAYGAEPKLPAWLLRRSIDSSLLTRGIDFSIALLRRLEKVSRPRWFAVAGAGRVHGAVCMAMAVLLAVPIPGVNILAAFGVAGIGVGILGRDGVLVTAGLALSALALIAAAGVISGAFLLHEAIF